MGKYPVGDPGMQVNRAMDSMPGAKWLPVRFDEYAIEMEQYHLEDLRGKYAN